MQSTRLTICASRVTFSLLLITWLPAVMMVTGCTFAGAGAEEIDTPQPTRVIVPLGIPIIDVESARPPGLVAVLCGANWPPNTVVFISLRDPSRSDQTPPPVISVQTDELGAFADLHVPYVDPSWADKESIDVIAEVADIRQTVTIHSSGLMTEPLETLPPPPAPAGTDTPGPPPTPANTLVPTDTPRPPEPPTPPPLPALTPMPTPRSPSNAFPDWTAEYYGNCQSCFDVPALIRNDKEIDFDWGSGSPGGNVPADFFSVRWKRDIDVPAGTYHFEVRVDDGVRVWVDGVVMIEGWKAASGNQTSVYAQDISLSRGRHPVVVEMYEATGLASIRFTYSKLETYRCWKAEYFDNPRLEGAPKITRNEDLLRFNWGNGSPEKAQVPENGFSARWTRKIDFPGGMTTFVMDTDDGARLKINGQTVVDGWADGAERTMSGTVNLTAGTHEIAIEYYENTGNASFRFYYDPGRQNRIWKGEYFDDAKLDGQATMITYANALNLDWGTGSPDLCAVPRDDFSARFTRDLPIERPGVYRFTVTVDDGVKVYLDGQMARDEWHDANSPTYSFLVDLQQGVTLVTVEYFEGRGFARIQMGEPEWVGDIPAPLPPSPTPTATPPPPTITPCHCS